MHILRPIFIALAAMALSFAGCTEEQTADLRELGSSSSPPTDQPLTEDRPVGPNRQDPTTPLAIVPPLPPDDANTQPGIALREGSIQIGRECVTWIPDGEGDVTTLVWYDGSAIYDEETNSITFTNTRDEVTVIKDGHRAVVDGTPATGTRNYLVAPSIECPEIAWLVGDVSP